MRVVYLAAGLLIGWQISAQALPEREFELMYPGEKIVDYAAYGTFYGLGTADFEYEITDAAGLAAAAGEGVYPNESHRHDPGFRDFERRHPERVNAWDWLDAPPQESFYAWLKDETVPQGVKLFYIADAFYRGGLINEAVKAYHALIVHFPQTRVASLDKSFHWYPAVEAASRIRKLCAAYPEIGLQLEGAWVENKNDAVHARPGALRPAELKPAATEDLEVVQTRGGRKVSVVQFANGHWQVRKDGKPFFIKGVTYVATTVGESPHAATLRSWMRVDDNKNGRNDGMFDSWIDANRNNVRDNGEPTVGDARLLKDMGANAIRFYHTQDDFNRYDPSEYDKNLMRTLARDYGIFFIMGDFLGAYTIGSGAAWEAGTDYTSPAQRERLKEMVRQMVLDHKDEPYVLMWLLGNENQHPHTRTNAARHPREYARFVNDVARMIKELDPDHPVAICNLQDHNLRELAELAPDVDIYGTNVYSGAFSMGSVVQKVRHLYDRPLLFTEWGADAYAEGRGPDEEAQAAYIRGNWEDILLHSAGGTGEGNVIGGILFEWMDEWWKTHQGDGWGSPKVHDTRRDYHLPFPDGWAHEEWFGIMSQGDGRHSPYVRQPRRAYYTLKELWNQ